MTVAGAVPEGISRYGAIPPKRQRASHGITRWLLSRPWVETAREGFAVMSGSSHGIAPVQGNNSPDKEFRYLRHSCYSPHHCDGPGHFCLTPHVAMRIGLSHHPFEA